jgi:DNA helicase II / ATP-dependent DNA helicase PcrA
MTGSCPPTGSMLCMMERKGNDVNDVLLLAASFAELNLAQRRAVEFGLDAGGPPPPLLIAAGAGTGKTKTLAHRVARLILGGADPRRILLLTFTRRAAQEMTRRAQAVIVGNGAGGESRAGAEAGFLPWAGTFHAIGNRLLRLHASHLGVDPAFTVLDRGNASDLMDLARGELGFAGTRSRFPQKATCLAIYSFTVNAGCPPKRDPQRWVPVVRRVGNTTEAAVRCLCRGEAAR